MSVNGQDSGDVADQALVPVPPQVEEPPREMRVAEVVEPEETAHACRDSRDVCPNI